MTRYHMNSKTGRVNICRAERGKCPLGSVTHGDSKEEVRENYEQAMKREEIKSLTKTVRPEKTAGETALSPWLDYLKEKIGHSRTEWRQKEQLRGDYSRAVAFARGKRAPEATVPKEQTLDSYIDYLKEKLPSRVGRHYKEQESFQAEYSRIISFGRDRGLTTR